MRAAVLITLMLAAPASASASGGGGNADAMQAAFGNTVDTIRDYLGLDSLHYLSVAGLVEATGLGRDTFCLRRARLAAHGLRDPRVLWPSPVPKDHGRGLRGTRTV